MKSYRKYDWPALLKEFAQSGLTQTQFCLNKDINPKYFSQKRKGSKAPEDTGFTKVNVQAPSGIILEVYVDTRIGIVVLAELFVVGCVKKQTV